MRKKLLSFSALLAASMLMGVQAQSVNDFKTDDAVRKVRSVATAEGINMYPCKVESYYSNNNTFELELGKTVYFEYVKPGLASVIKESNNKSNKYYISLYKYNENDIEDEFISGWSDVSFDDLFINHRYTYKYDEIVKDFCIEEGFYVNKFDDNTQEPEWEFKRNTTSYEIVRDEQNRVLELKSTKNKKYVTHIRHEYGEGVGPETLKIIEVNTDTGEEKLIHKYFNMKWDVCDNQLFDQNKLSDYRDGKIDENNILRSYDYIEYYNGDFYALRHMEFEYDENNRLISLDKWNYDDEEKKCLSARYTNTWEYTDDFGSFKKSYYKLKDYNGDGVYSDDEKCIYSQDINLYNEKGLIINDTSYSWEDDEISDMESMVYTYKYDDMGRVVELYKEEQYGIDEPLLPDFKEVYEYDDTTTGIASVNRNSMDLKVNGSVVTFGSTDGRYVVSNADGKLVMAGSAADSWVSLENLPAGLYIVKVNGCAVKVIR